MTERPYFSIGEVLGLLLEEFTDVTISKIRFLESQGLIDPERTSSGYRKFYDGDVERLRYILREQKDNYLPLKVIKERLDGIDHTLPNPPRPLPAGASWMTSDETPDNVEPETTVEPEQEPFVIVEPIVIVEPVIIVEPAIVEPVVVVEPLVIVEPAPPPVTPTAPVAPMVPPSITPAAAAAAVAPRTDPAPEPTPAPVRALSIVRTPPPAELQLTAAELCARAEISSNQLTSLVDFGLITGRAVGAETTYGAAALRIAEIAHQLIGQGLEVRHLRAWKMAADKEAGLFEQLVLPLVRQRNPQARQQAVATIAGLAALGGELRELMVTAALADYLDT